MEDESEDPDERSTARLDVAVGLPGQATVYLDTTVVDAYSENAATEEERLRHPGAAARMAEDRKRDKYHHGANLVPFAVECHGRLGEGARAWLAKAYKGLPDRRRRLVAEIAAAVQSHTGAMIAAACA